jgi:hypothetical protein
MNVSQGIDHEEIQKMCKETDFKEKQMKTESIALGQASKEVIIKEDLEDDQFSLIDNSKLREDEEIKKK